jgi:hypothetical protein
MNTKDEEQSKNDWFQRLDRPLKVVSAQYARLFHKKNELTKNQMLLKYYNAKKPNNISHNKNDFTSNENLLLRRINIYNYKNLGRENNIMKNILSQIQEYKDKKDKDNRYISLKLKKIKSNNDFDQIKLNNKNNYSHSYHKPLNSNISSTMISPIITDRNKEEEKPLKLKLNINIENNSHINDRLYFMKHNKSIFLLENNLNNNSRNESDNGNNFFQTLTRVDKYDEKNCRKKKKLRKFNKIENLNKMLKAIRDEEDNGKIIKKDILYIKKSKRYANSLNKCRPIDLSANYSKIRTKKDIELKILNNNPGVQIFNHLKKNIKENSQKRLNTMNNSDIYNKSLYYNSNNQTKKDLILPICPKSHK